MQDKINNADSDDEQSLRTAGYTWAVRISNIGIEMVLPAVLGIWLDRQFGTVVLFVILGTFLGVFLGFWQLLKIARNH